MKNPLNIYIVPGLACTNAMFAKLQSSDDFRFLPVEWVQSKHHEEFANYCTRLLDQIDHSSPFIISGVSFGSLVAREMNRQLGRDETIMISGFVHVREICQPFRTLLRLRCLHALLSRIAIHRISPAFIINFFFSIDDRETAHVLRKMLKAAPPCLLVWSIEQVARYDSIAISAHSHEKLIRIHGSSDRVITCPTDASSHIIEDAGHFMIYSHALEVTQRLTQIASTLTTPRPPITK